MEMKISANHIKFEAQLASTKGPQSIPIQRADKHGRIL